MAYTIASQVAHEWYTAAQHGWTSGDASFADLTRNGHISGPRNWCFNELRMSTIPMFNYQRRTWYCVDVVYDADRAVHVCRATAAGFEVQWYQSIGHIKYGLFGNTASRLSRRIWLLNHRIKQGAASC